MDQLGTGQGEASLCYLIRVLLPASPRESRRNGQVAFSSKMTTASFPAAGNAFLLRNAAESKLHS